MAKVRIRQRGKTWSYSFDAYTFEGKKKIVEKGGFQTKQIAYDEGVKAFAKYKGGDIRFSSDKITVVNFLNLWLEEKKDDLKVSSIHTYKSIFATLSKFLGNVLLQELKPRDVNSIVKKLQKCGYSRGTIHKHLKLLREVLSYAVYPAELISSNPALFIKVPKNAPTNIIKREVISREKLDSILEDFPFSHPFHIPILIEGNAIPKGVASRLGHSDAAITQNLYTHNTEHIQQQTISIFEEILEKNEFC